MIKSLLKKLTLLCVFAVIFVPVLVGAVSPNNEHVKLGVQLIRHATMILDIQGKKILVDPMLAPAGSLNAFPTVPHHDAKNPLMELPITINELCKVDAILVTHTHIDHFDDAAMRELPKDKPLFCQPEDYDKIKAAGFTQVMLVSDKLSWENIKIKRVSGIHGYGDAAKWLAPVSGFVLSATNGKSVYLTGDTVWCEEVKANLMKVKPAVTIVFGGAAQFADGSPITMTVEGIYELCKLAPQTKVVAVHMDAINHCIFTREQLRQCVKNTHLENQVSIPENGENLTFVLD